MRLVLILAAASITLAGCKSKPAGEPVFQKAYWGMTDEEIRAAYPNAVPDGADLRVGPHDVGGWSAITTFGFTPSAGLAMIDNWLPPKATDEAFIDLREKLQTKYGAGTEMPLADELDRLEQAKQVDWSQGDTRISLSRRKSNAMWKVVLTYYSSNRVTEYWRSRRENESSGL